MLCLGEFRVSCNEHIPSNLGVTGATWPSADVDLIGEQLDRLEALRIVGADRGENGVEQRTVRRTDAERRLHCSGKEEKSQSTYACAHHSGAYVERITLLIRNPRLFQAQELLDAFKHLGLVEALPEKSV